MQFLRLTYADGAETRLQGFYQHQHPPHIRNARQRPAGMHCQGEAFHASDICMQRFDLADNALARLQHVLILFSTWGSVQGL